MTDAGELLTTLGRVKAWLGIPDDNTSADALLNVLIKSASAFVLNYLNRDSFELAEVSEVYDGYGNREMVLRRTPVYDVSALSFSGVPISAALGNGFDVPYSNGWVYGDGRLTLFGMAFPRCKHAVAIRYRAGYVTSDEAVVPADPWQITVTNTWLSDVGVTVDGVALAKVTGSPGSGEYSVSTSGVYTFNVAQEGGAAVILYSYVPADVEQAVWEIVGERYKYRDRIGQNSKTLGGQETVSFSREAMPQYIRELLQPYKHVVPVA